MALQPLIGPNALRRKYHTAMTRAPRKPAETTPPEENEVLATVRSFRPSPKAIKIGAAVGIGSAAIVAALLYVRTNGRKEGK